MSHNDIVVATHYVTMNDGTLVPVTASHESIRFLDNTHNRCQLTLTDDEDNVVLQTEDWVSVQYEGQTYATIHP